MAMQAMTNWVIIPRFWYLRSDTRDSSSRLIRALINQHHQLYDCKLCTGGRLWKHNALLDKWMVQVCKGWRILIYLDFMRAGNTGTMGGWYLLSSDIYDRQFSQVLILMKTDKYYKNDINHVEIMRFPPAQRGDVISYPSLFPLPVSSFWSRKFGSVLGIKYHFWCVLLLFFIWKSNTSSFHLCGALFFNPKSFATAVWCQKLRHNRSHEGSLFCFRGFISK